MNTLFSAPQAVSATSQPKPLADALRPAELDQVVGQPHLLGERGVLTGMVTKGFLPSLIFWGPPGCGKTTIARLLAQRVGYYFDTVSAVASGTAELKTKFAEAKQRLSMGTRTLLLVDEIHRFNRAQQDVFLPYVEDGTIILLGATTENPSFELNSALLSRCRVLVLNRLDAAALLSLIARAEAHYHNPLPLDDEGKQALCAMADGDGRYLLNMCEELFAVSSDTPLTQAQLVHVLQKRMPLYDKHQDSHYNLISALHKSLRGSDVNAALYWFARMLDGGENPLYIVRRLVRFAVEDIGMADPYAVVQANAAKDAYDFLGSPEGELAIAQLVVYLATAPKSNAVYKAYNTVVKDAKANGSLMPPKHILNAPTKLMKQEGYGEGYAYDHDTPEGFSGQNYFPETMARANYYRPSARGFEKEINKRLEYWDNLRKKKSS